MNDGFINLKPEEFEAQQLADTSAILLDVRTPDEVAEGHIPGSMNIDFNNADFLVNVLDLDLSKDYYVYCRSGARSTKACLYMRSAGASGKIYNLDGGILAWTGKIEK